MAGTEMWGPNERSRFGRTFWFVPLVSWFLPCAAVAQPTDTSSSSVPRIDTPASVAEQPESDSFDLYFRASSNVQIFRRALLPGPGGAIVESETLAPLHQSLSAQAARVDSPLQDDSVEIQVATWGMFVIGSPDELKSATWDISSAFVRQRYRSVALTLGRQPVVGGAARYSRLDGAVLDVDLGQGFVMSTYGGWTVLPRWNQWYGVHHLGDAYDDWTNPEVEAVDPKRNQNWMAGARSQWSRPELGSLGVSFHYQAENESIYQKNIGLNAAMTALDDWDFRADAIVNADSMRFSDIRASVAWDALRKESAGLSLRGELLHTVPSLLLSQASVFSVFSHEEVTEVGGQAEARVGRGFRLRGSGFSQMYQLGKPGYRLGLGGSYRDDEGTFFVRLMSNRVRTLDNGYWMARLAASYEFIPRLSAIADSYQYFYDEAIRDVKRSSFYALHLRYQNDDFWDARIGGSITSSPYAKLDAQVLARLTIEIDAGRNP